MNQLKRFQVYINFCNGDLNKFVILLIKSVFPYEYMGSCEKFTETVLPLKKDFYSNLNLEDISDEDYAHAQKVWDVFKIKSLGEYHDSYVKTDTLLLADLYENLTNMCLNMYELDLYILYLHLD